MLPPQWKKVEINRAKSISPFVGNEPHQLDFKHAIAEHYKEDVWSIEGKGDNILKKKIMGLISVEVVQ